MSLHRILSSSSIALLLFTVAGLSNAAGASGTTLRGTVESGGTGLAGYQVSLYARFVDPHGNASVVGRSTTGPSGEFKIDYHLPRGHSSASEPLLFVRARSGPASRKDARIRLASSSSSSCFVTSAA